MDTLTRAGLALLIVLSGTSFYLLYQQWTKIRAPGLLSDLGPRRPGATTLVYFTTSTCVPCKTIQRPAIQKASQMLGDTLQVLEIDASERPEIAQRWGVLSVPTTFVIDPDGQVRHVNHGITRAEKLMRQIHNH